jgi:hypothetical protein
MRAPAQSESRLLRLFSRGTLAVLMLTTTGLESPALEHAHAGGDRPHRHATHWIRGQQEFAPHFAADRECQSAALIDVVPHVHVSILGFELTLPLPADDHGRPCGDEHGPALCRIDDQTQPLTSTAQPNPAAFLLPAALCRDVSAVVVVEMPPRVERFRVAPVLCDTARHERSGVQLA